MDKSPSKPVENVILKAPNATDIAGQRMDSYRFSMANLEGKIADDEIINAMSLLSEHIIIYIVAALVTMQRCVIMYRLFFRVSDTQDVDLDAVLGELCALESQYQSTNSLLDSEKIGM